ncbi:MULTISPECIES: ectoine synthase [unclassified Oleiphilus]|uniref:ectoine synthase n=3 Tax=Oleiphilus TaxID=141450 RepID=UPI0007C3A923|nr:MULTISPECIES: ectoine synthase [unclassified Oleiphilus]KZY42202.1 L-ectoine synthase [Oleiphilus sp. HI0050]KZY77630.1 L-ectoine synthase [Oleiphilus sp. HI0068]KZY77795.1 L-ectoine synthase [Oleiphilus sp. HI0069]KZY90576.1 L-ectoine synthase [Oleiphilus sp. HI0072]KZZ08874.1 L-ectoine synthase [Oleiphilus sp. HI0078]KZZ46314.1 L-ectoine synthase [Oleiphilus sp. HI0085]
MIVRKLSEAENSSRRIVSPDGNWESTRMLLKDDQMGFSFHITTIYEGADFQMHYQNHLESVYCMSGEGEIENLEDGKVHPISAGTIYVLDKHDKHILRAFKEMKMACVFNPPLNGKEVHNKEGAYELEADTIE